MKHKTVCGVRRNRILSTLMSNHRSVANGGQAFSLKSGQEFASRSKQIFDGLETLEHEYETRQPVVPNESFEESNTVADDVLDDTTQCFKRPRGIAPRKKKKIMDYTPDYLKHPKKWQKYSLADVPEHTDEANTQAAMKMLKDIEKVRAVRNCVNETPLFQKRLDGTVYCKESKTHFLSSGSVAIMPECVVGQKPLAVMKQKKERNVEQKDKVTLSHLTDVPEY